MALRVSFWGAIMTLALGAAGAVVGTVGDAVDRPLDGWVLGLWIAAGVCGLVALVLRLTVSRRIRRHVSDRDSGADLGLDLSASDPEVSDPLFARRRRTLMGASSARPAMRAPRGDA